MALPMDCFADEMLRRCVVGQIEAARDGVMEPGPKSSQEIEETLFEHATCKDEYMQLIASVVLHYKQMKRSGVCPPRQFNGTAEEETEEHGRREENGRREEHGRREENGTTEEEEAAEARGAAKGQVKQS